jgi:hypothetical protein
VTSIITLKELIAYLEEKPRWRTTWPRFARIAKTACNENCPVAALPGNAKLLQLCGD